MREPDSKELEKLFAKVRDIKKERPTFVEQYERFLKDYRRYEEDHKRYEERFGRKERSFHHNNSFKGESGV